MKRIKSWLSNILYNLGEVFNNVSYKLDKDSFYKNNLTIDTYPYEFPKELKDSINSIKPSFIGDNGDKLYSKDIILTSIRKYTNAIYLNYYQKDLPIDLDLQDNYKIAVDLYNELYDTDFDYLLNIN